MLTRTNLLTALILIKTDNTTTTAFLAGKRHYKLSYTYKEGAPILVFRQKQGIMSDNDYDDENEAKEQKEGTHC